MQSMVTIIQCTNTNQKRLKVSDINTQSILSFYTAVIEKKSDNELIGLIPKVSVEIELVDPKN